MVMELDTFQIIVVIMGGVVICLLLYAIIEGRD
jgi:hypothetical protein